MITYIVPVSVLSFWGDHAGHAIAVAKCDEPEVAEALAQNEANRRGRKLATQCVAHSLDDWRKMHSGDLYVESMVDQLDALSANFLMSPFDSRDHFAEPALCVVQMPLPALPEETDAPFWDGAWCSSTFHQFVFGGGRKTYVIIDCGITQTLPGGFIPEALSEEHTVKCLYTGGLLENMADTAPYLVDLTLRDDQPTTFQRNFARQIWGQSAGIIMRTDEEFDDVWNHLRKFTRIRSGADAEKWTYFRFWNPLVAATYFGGATPEPTIGERFCSLDNNRSLQLIIEDSSDAATLIWPKADATQVVARNTISFNDTDQLLMAKVAERAFRRELAEWLVTAHADRFESFSKSQMRNVTRHISLEGARLGCTTKDDMVYLCHMMLSVGGWFHISGILPNVSQILQNTTAPKAEHLANVFVDDCDETPKTELFTNWAAVRAHIGAFPEEELLTPAQFRRLLNSFIIEKRDGADNLLRIAKSEIATLELSQLHTGKFLFLTLLLGYRFHTDPTLPWCDMNTISAIDAAWVSMFN